MHLGSYYFNLLFFIQVLLINAVKDVASALSDLISATKNASGKSVNDPAMLALKESAKVIYILIIYLCGTVYRLGL